MSIMSDLPIKEGRSGCRSYDLKALKKNLIEKISPRIAEEFSNSVLSEYDYNAHVFFVILSPALYYKAGKPLNEIPKKITN